MEKKNNRIEKAKKILFENTPAERIIDAYDCGDYVQFDCKAGGDLLMFRIYNNGFICEK